MTFSLGSGEQHIANPVSDEATNSWLSLLGE